MSLPEDQLTPELEALKAKHAGRPPLGTPAAEGPSPDAVLEATRRTYEPRVVEDDEKPESDEQLGFYLASLRKVYSDVKTNGLPSLEERERIQQEAEALARQEAREQLDVTNAEQEEPSTAEILGVVLRPPEAYQPPPPAEGETWRPEIVTTIQGIASEFAFSDAEHALVYAEITRGYAAPEISMEERLERTAELIREHKQRLGADYERLVGRANRILAAKGIPVDLWERAGMDVNPRVVALMLDKVRLAERYNRLLKLRQGGDHA